MRRGRLIAKMNRKLTRRNSRIAIAEGLPEAKVPIKNPELTGPVNLELELSVVITKWEKHTAKQRK